MITVNVKKKLGSLQLKVRLDLTGGINVIVGPSGCGKTSTLNMIAGFQKPDAGEISINGRPVFACGAVDLPIHKRDIAYVLQEPALFPHLSVKDNILYGVRSGRHTGRDLAGEVRELMEMLRIKGLEELLPAQISGGQAQRVALARAVITRPQLLLLDEPFSSLDEQVRREVGRELQQVIRLYGIPAVMVTHHLQEALSLGDTMAVMMAGRIRQTGPPSQVFAAPANSEIAAFLGVQPQNS